MAKRWKIIFIISNILYFPLTVDKLNTYRAAVVEYAPKLISDNPTFRILENTKEYVAYIQRASDQNVDIIVFPEDGLTGWENILASNVDQLSTNVPDPKETNIPCSSNRANHSKALIDLSCAAETHQIYVVVNLIERDFNTTAKKIVYHNTNVVFDKTGAVVARYRKMNLFNEYLYEKGNEVVTFDTSFGVKFGMFICFDLLFKTPALDVLQDPQVTDVVYSVAWFSELPFLESLSVQHGYAIANGINLLSAGLDEPSKRNGGSGIFLANGKIAESYISGAKSSKMIIRDVPKISRRSPGGTCKSSNVITDTQDSPNLSVGGGTLPGINFFKTGQEDMRNYTFKDLDLSKTNLSEKICSSNSKFCCSVNITVSKHNTPSNYVYKLTAWNGVRRASTKTLGVHNCGLVACLYESSTTCGLRSSFAPTTVFENISITTSFKDGEVYNQPSTLHYDLKPLSDYTFCKKFTRDGQAEITMFTTKPQDSLLTFGIFGRVYSNDNKPRGTISGAPFHFMNIYVIFLVSIIIFLLQD